MDNKWLFFNEADEEEDKKKDDDKEEKDKDKEEKEDKKEEDKKDDGKDDKKEKDDYNDILDKDDEEEIKDSDPDASDEEFKDELEDDTKESEADDEFNTLLPEDNDDDEFPSYDDGEEDTDIGDVDNTTSSGDDYNDILGDESSGDGEGLYETIAKVGYAYTVISNNMHHVHLCVSGRKFDTIHKIAESLYDHFSEKVDWLLELAMEGSVQLDNESNSAQHCEDIPLAQEGDYDYESACATISENLSAAIRYMQDARRKADMRTDIQSEIDSELTYLNKQLRYFMARRYKGGFSGEGDGATKETHIDIVSKVEESYNDFI